MNKQFIKIPTDKIDQIKTSIIIVKAINGKVITKDELIEALDMKGLILTPEIKKSFLKDFPELELD